ncbi:NAD(P)-dependent oxidoreductase [Serratia marcescens]
MRTVTYCTENEETPLRKELSRSTAGILGYGEIGRCFAAKAGPLFGRVLGLSRTAAADRHLERVFRPDELCAFLAECDFVLVCVPYSSHTHGLLSARELEAMRPDATLINVARGPVVDEQALYDALVHNRLRGAVLDVWWNYPTSDGGIVKPANLPFERLPQVIHTPHLSGWTEEIVERRWESVARNIAAAVGSEGALEQVVRPGVH